jgi:N-acetylmuramoyl-L-alanine amidase
MIPRHAKENLGWLTGLEPATAGTTNRSSTIELQPPSRDAEATKTRASAKGNFCTRLRRLRATIAAFLLIACSACASPVIVIDAGHGGHDRGGMPGQRVTEKGYALDVAKRLNSALRHAGMRTVMTRSGDYFVTLQDRASIGNMQSRAVFVSIHFNGAPNPDAYGFEVYYYRSRESYALADRIMRKLVSSTNVPGRWVRPRSLYVLSHSRFPAVLCELGFLTNRDEARRISSSSYRQRMAQAIASAIMSSYR